ncbi:ferritin-like domain-containing protein [Sorangium sp. So ce260]|uniref:ferritin-like domain-containing protein n=1 Tax=Sorangium sp. So ce260 TaxID=3133291 RepID=UPI003F644324
MRKASSIHRGFLVPSFAPLRASIWAALGLSVSACGGHVTVDPASGEGGGEGGVTTSSTGTPAPSFVCDGAVPLPQRSGAYSGYARCPDGTIHRVEAVACESSLPACQGIEDVISCKTDADCTEKPGGKCGSYPSTDFNGTAWHCGCVYACATDQDCDPGQACLCPGVVLPDRLHARCVSAGCLASDDCASGECGLSVYDDGCGFELDLVCRAPGDACRTDADCGSGYEACVAPYDRLEWACSPPGCFDGRPLLVEGRARTARRVARSDWAFASLTPETAGLRGDVRAALAAHWREIAAVEHASIASFARFSLELLALGAPPALLAGAQQAAMDEVAHARAAYTLASAYAGAALGPGPLDMTGVAPATSAAAIVAALVEEACVGETISAAQARALAGLVRDPALAGTYERIAEEEGRHAELGWRALAWLLGGAGDDLRATAASAFDRAVARLSADPEVAPGAVAPEHGLLSGAMLGALRRQALAEVVEPCRRALLG